MKQEEKKSTGMKESRNEEMMKRGDRIKYKI